MSETLLWVLCSLGSGRPRELLVDLVGPVNPLSLSPVSRWSAVLCQLIIVVRSRTRPPSARDIYLAWVGPNMMGLSPGIHPTISVLGHYFQGRGLGYWMYCNPLSSRYPSVEDYNISSIIILRSLWYGRVYLGGLIKAKIMTIFDKFWQMLTILTIFDNFDNFANFWQFFGSFQSFWKFLWPETWHLRHWLHFWQQQYGQLHCDLWTESDGDSIRNSCDVSWRTWYFGWRTWCFVWRI